MLFEIRHRYTGAILFRLKCGSIKVCVEAAINAGANLDMADLTRANLARADLTRANLTRANLARADLTRANLAGANLAGADLARADLAGANLDMADLTRANLARADLTRANLARADLTRANLTGADLAGADLTGATNANLVLATHRITPTDGAFVGWKSMLANGQKCIAQIIIPHDAQRINALGSRKCRASKVSVHAMWLDGKPFEGPAYDARTGKTEYRVGQEVLSDKFDPDIRIDCSHGIHFFLSREEAEVW